MSILSRSAAQARFNAGTTQGLSRGLVGGQQAFEQPDNDRDLFGVGDVLAAPFRGIEGAAQGIYGLADTILFDALPDYEHRFLGESQTAVGGVVEGISQFAAGFFVPGGAVAKIGKIGALADKGVKGKIALGAIKGAVADFTVFDGNEARLSNLIQMVPALQNPVTDFLAADDSDGELFGRFKNSVEGLGIGSLTDAVILGVKRIKAGKIVRDAGGTPDEVLAAEEAAVPAADIAEAAKVPYDPIPDHAKETVPERITPGRENLTPERAEEILKASGKTKEDILAMLNREYDGVAATNPRNLPEDAGTTNPRGLNLLQLGSSEEVAAAIRLIENDEFAEGAAKRVGLEKVSIEEQDKAASDYFKNVIGKTDDPVRKMLGESIDVRESARKVGVRLRGLRAAHELGMRELHEKIVDIRSTGNNSDAAFVELLQQKEVMGEIHMQITGAASEFGRNLRSLQGNLKLNDASLLTEALDNAGGRKAVEKWMDAFEIAYQEGGAAAASKMVAVTRGRAALNFLNSYWINSILSGPLTQVVNATSGAMMSVWRPLEQISGSLGGVLAGREGAQEAMASAFRELNYLWTETGESFRLAIAAAKKGEGILTNTNKVDLPTDRSLGRAGVEAITGKPLSEGAGRAANWIGTILEAPSTLLTGMDEFVKQVNYRASVKSDLMGEALKNGLNPEDAAKEVAERFQSLIHEGQAYSNSTLYKKGLEDAKAKGITNPIMQEQHAAEFAHANHDPGLSAIAKRAIEAGEQSTFTTKLDPKSISGGVSTFVNAHPVFRLVMPFIRTPFNLASYALDRSYIGALRDAPPAMKAVITTHFGGGRTAALEATRNKLTKELLSDDPRVAAAALGRLNTAVGVSATVTMAVASGSLTGRGPTDPELRRLLENSGWQPYSIKVADGYVSYQRFDPFSTSIAMLADIASYSKFAAEDDQSILSQAYHGGIVALANNFTNKTYFKGIGDLVALLTKPDQTIESTSRKFLSSLIPFSSFGSQTTGAVDPNLRDIETLSEAIRAKVPFFSDDLAPMRNVLGDPVARNRSLGADTLGSWTNMFVPIAYRETSDDLIDKEFLKLKHGFNPPKSTRLGIDLREYNLTSGQNAYDRWLELHGQVQIQGRDLKRSLRRLIKSRGYQSLPDETIEDLKSPKIREVDGLIRRFRAKAFDQLLKESPELKAKYSLSRRVRRELRRGNDLRELLR